MTLCTFVQKANINGHVLHICSIVLVPAPHLQKILGRVGVFLWRIAGFLYHLVRILYPISWILTFLDPELVDRLIDSQSASHNVISSSFSQVRHVLSDLAEEF